MSAAVQGGVGISLWNVAAMSILCSLADSLGSSVGTGERAAANEDAAAVADAHALIDQQVAAFARETTLHCPPGCGRCCLSPDVETSVADLLPLAEHVVHTGLAESIMHRLDSAAGAGSATGPGDRRCVLYEPDPSDPARGRCSMYEVRPSICRLFGFAGRRNADGQPQFSPCRVHSELMPDLVADIRAALAERRVSLPIFADLAGQATAAAPNADARLMPINVALRKAIETIGLSAMLRALASAEQRDHHDDEDLTPPTTPHIPRRPRRAA